MNREQILNIIGNIYVGYNPDYTADTAIATATARINSHLQTSFSLSETRKMMENENIISCAGLDNYLIKLYQKMNQAANQKTIKVA